MNDLELQRKSLPNEPGVYFFKNKTNKIIYVGKAVNLRKRVSSYFVKSSYNDPYYEEKIKEMVKEINSIEFIVTENEKEAYILENLQIKAHRPRFNVFMRDSKSYPWITIFYGEKYPRIRVIRNPENYPRENSFIGPYTDKKEIVRILRDLRKIFPYCSCKKPVTKRKRPCLYYQLNLCPGPCMDKISSDKYITSINKIELFLKGETDDLKNQIIKKMEDASQLQDFETAAYWRDKLMAINNSTSNQSVLLETNENKDIIGFYSDLEQKYFAMVIIHIREGRFLNTSSFTLDLNKKVIQKIDLFPVVMEQYYQDSIDNLPHNIIVPHFYENIEFFKQVLLDYNHNVQIRTPLKEELGLLRIANKNAKVIVEQEISMDTIKLEQEKIQINILEEAKKLLDLPTIPRVIEGFDISNIEGKNATGSMVYFLEGKPYKKRYRHYNIRTKQSPDDVGMMKEVIRRRYSKLQSKNLELPNLILVDGGKAQLNAGITVLNELGLNIPIIGLAKKNEEIYLARKKTPIKIPLDSEVIKLFQNVRDEAHRFAVRLHKKKREKTFSRSILDTIEGVGPVTRKKLLKEFGSIKNIKKATVEEIAQIVGLNKAEKIIKFLDK